MSTPFLATVTVPGRVESVRPAAAFLVETARALNVPAVENRLFEVAIVEALNNALKHNPRAGDQPLHCEIELDGRCLRIRVLDEAAPAPVTLALSGSAPNRPDFPDAWQQVQESGYGLYLMRAVFAEVKPVTRNGCHGVEMALSV